MRSLVAVDHSGDIERLWWLDLAGGLHGATHLDGSVAIALHGPARGVAAGCGRVAVWDDDSLWLLKADSGEIVATLTLSGHRFEVAHVVDGGLEVGAAETTGHPTDRAASLWTWRFDEPWSKRVHVARGGYVPPLGWRGSYPWTRTVRWSGPEGYIVHHHERFPSTSWWVGADSRRKRLSGHLARRTVGAFSHAERVYLACWQTDRLHIHRAASTDRVFRHKARGTIRGVAHFRNDLVVLAGSSQPYAVPGFRKKMARLV